MTTYRQGFGPDGRPLCFNREAMATYSVNERREVVREHPEDMAVVVGQRVTLIPWNFSRGCTSWVADPSTAPVPMAEGWKCGGCVHYPSEAVDLALTRRHDRKLREAK